MTQFAPGTEDAVVQAELLTSSGTYVDTTTITVSIIDSLGETLFNEEAPTRTSLGHYEFQFDIDIAAPQGMWVAKWSYALDSGSYSGVFEDSFFVGNEAFVLSEDDALAARLLSRLGEPAAADEIFSATDIADLLAYAEGDLNVATLEGWKRKAARLSRLIDVTESGSDRNLGDKFRNAKKMLDYWGEVMKDETALADYARAGRVVGKVVNLRRLEDPTPGTPFSGYSEHIREYPTHRFLMPAIL